jgi:hypothetical protein
LSGDGVDARVVAVDPVDVQLRELSGRDVARFESALLLLARVIIRSD